MLDSRTGGMSPARAYTGITTPFVLARQVRGTFFVYGTFGATIRGPTNIIFQTRASGIATHNTTLRIWPAGRWYTRIGRMTVLHNGWLYWERKPIFLNIYVLFEGAAQFVNPKSLTFFDATNKRIPRKSGGAAAYRIMVNDLAPSIQTASARTRVRALLLYAGFVLRTLRADHALWATSRRSADIIRLARADRVIVHLATLTVRSAWRWDARILRFSYK